MPSFSDVHGLVHVPTDSRMIRAPAAWRFLFPCVLISHLG
jgi:hypothetical protein